MSADECADLLHERFLLIKTPPKGGFNFREMLRQGRDKKILFMKGAFQERPRTRWVIRNLS
ncbi:hypothetical protein [Fulvivirga ligni]|uniref:hypothetical protein n=1 Tax=Fulvivirga ligni TaxID=2904246 RepID=UPI001F3D1C7F|nr:hypothetical protein [Fulvivirga ligni]UII21661.1 hypothetical protein LVD16_00210 [Fulvivirga ligni]